ncbi:MAG: [acyl-carrier-protein] S-malonyltransferase, partial [Paludibacter sp.]
MKAFVFPGQGAQFIGMGKDLYENYPIAKEYFDKANEILGFNITEIMFDGTLEELKETRVTQPAIFIHSVISALVRENSEAPDIVAGHSLGEFSALVVAKVLSFEDGLKLVYTRALAMQKACEIEKSTMAAVLSLENEVVEEVCAEINKELMVVPANYNCPGQVVISGSLEGVDKACEVLKERGAKRALRLQVSGAFHSPMMNPAKEELQKAIQQVTF